MSIKKNNTYFKENDGKVYYYDENGVPSAVPNSAFGTLKNELESTSAELVDTLETTSGILHGKIDTASGNLQEQIDNIGSPLTYSGTKTVDEINALENIKQGTVYTMSNSGTITAGDIEVEQSDEIAYANGWVKIGKDFQKELSAGTDLKYEDGVFSVNTNGSAKGEYSFVEGKNTFAGGLCDHVEGMGGIADNGGMNHIEGFQYHSYCSNGPATNFNNTNIVRFPNVYPVRLRNNDIISYDVKLYELVKIFKDRFIVSCDYGGGDGAGIFHYTQNPFYNPELYKIIDVDLDSSTNEILITIDGIINVPGSSNGSIQLYGPTTINSINGTGGSLSSGKTLNTFIFNGGLGFPGNCLDNVRLDNTFISINLGYTKTGEQEPTSISKIIEIKNIEFDSSNNSFTFTTEDIEIPDIIGGGYSLSLYVINSTYNGCNHIEGQDNSIHYACNSHAEGFCNTITNNCSHIEGSFNYASNPNSHAEGRYTSACGLCSHTEGYGTSIYTNASYAHAEGYQTKVSGQAAHAEGSATIASGDASHAEGVSSIANDCCSHSEGYQTNANGYCSHSEGYQTNANGQQSHTEGFGTIAGGYNSHAEGNQTKATDSQAHAEGWETLASNQNTHAEGCKTSATGDTSHTEGYKTIASNSYTHAEGYETSACGYGSHAEGLSSYANGNYSHTEGQQTSALGNYSHAAGNSAVANGQCSFAYGEDVSAKGSYSVAFGYKTLANGWNSFAECYYNSAISDNSHAEGSYTIASGKASHAEGSGTIAGSDYMHVGGSYNKTSSDALFVIGNGSNDLNRSDAFIVSADGTVSAKRFIEDNPELTITGGDYVSVAEDTTNNKLIIDVDSDLGTMLTTLSGLLSAGAIPTNGRYILGVDNGTLTWLEVNQ